MTAEVRTSALSQHLDALIDYGFENVIGSTLEDTPPFKAIRAIADEMDRVLYAKPELSGVQRLVAERAAKDPMVPKTIDLTVPDRPWQKARVILSELHDVPGHTQPLIIGWDTCAKCLLHITVCTCTDGPTEPKSVQQWRESSGHVAPARAPDVVPTVVRKLPEVMTQVEVVPDTPESLALAAEAEVGYEVVDGQLTGRLAPPDQECKVCGIEVTTEGPDYNGDRNDDGTFTCLADQGGAA